MSRVRQVPQVPLSQELGTSWPAARSASRIDRSAGTSTTLAGAGEPHAKRAVVGLCVSRRRRESFRYARSKDDQCPVMSRTASSIGRGPQQYRCAPAGARVRATGRATLRIAVVVVDHDLPAQLGRGEFVAKRGLLGIARAVVELEARTAGSRAEMPHHRQDRRDPDASGDEKKVRDARHECEVVARRRARQRRADADLGRSGWPSRPAIRLALDRDLVVIALVGIVAQRIFSRQAVGSLNADMGARREWRQFGAVRVAQTEARDTLCDVADLGNDERQLLRSGHAGIGQPAPRQFARGYA